MSFYVQVTSFTFSGVRRKIWNTDVNWRRFDNILDAAFDCFEGFYHACHSAFQLIMTSNANDFSWVRIGKDSHDFLAMHYLKLCSIVIFEWLIVVSQGKSGYFSRMTVWNMQRAFVHFNSKWNLVQTLCDQKIGKIIFVDKIFHIICRIKVHFLAGKNAQVVLIGGKIQNVFTQLDLLTDLNFNFNAQIQLLPLFALSRSDSLSILLIFIFS